MSPKHHVQSQRQHLVTHHDESLDGPGRVGHRRRAHDESVGREVAVSEGVRWGVVGVGRCQEVSGGFKIWGLGVRA